MQAPLAINVADQSSVRLSSASSTVGDYVNSAGQRVHRNLGSDTSGYEQTMRSLYAEAGAELASLEKSDNGRLVIEITGSGTGPSAKYAASEPDTATSFMRGYNGEYRSVMEGDAPLAETVGRYAGAAVDSFKNFGDDMTGAGSMRNAMTSWQRGDYGLSLVQGSMAFAEAGSTVFGFGTAGAIRSSGTATLRTEAEAVANTTGLGGVTFEGTLYRAVGEGYDPLLIHPGNVAASHRYTGPGQGGLYFATGEHVVEAEFLNNGASLAGKQMHSFPNSAVSDLLDLSNPVTRETLGVSLGELTRTGGTQAWRYEVTQPLGAWAQQNGYRGVIAPSAQANGGVNVILFDAKSLK